MLYLDTLTDTEIDVLSDSDLGDMLDTPSYLTNEDYLAITDALGEMYVIGKQAMDRFSSIKQIVDDTDVGSTQVIVSNLLVQSFNQCKSVVYRNHLRLTNPMKLLTQKIQGYVSSEYQDIDEYLALNAILVSADFAELSGLCGYSINPANVR